MELWFQDAPNVSLNVTNFTAAQNASEPPGLGSLQHDSNTAFRIALLWGLALTAPLVIVVLISLFFRHARRERMAAILQHQPSMDSWPVGIDITHDHLRSFWYTICSHLTLLLCFFAISNMKRDKYERLGLPVLDWLLLDEDRNQEIPCPFEKHVVLNELACLSAPLLVHVWQLIVLVAVVMPVASILVLHVNNPAHSPFWALTALPVWGCLIATGCWNMYDSFSQMLESPTLRFRLLFFTGFWKAKALPLDHMLAGVLLAVLPMVCIVLLIWMVAREEDDFQRFKQAKQLKHTEKRLNGTSGDEETRSRALTFMRALDALTKAFPDADMQSMRDAASMLAMALTKTDPVDMSPKDYEGENPSPQYWWRHQKYALRTWSFVGTVAHRFARGLSHPSHLRNSLLTLSLAMAALVLVLLTGYSLSRLPVMSAVLVYHAEQLDAGTDQVSAQQNLTESLAGLDQILPNQALCAIAVMQCCARTGCWIEPLNNTGFAELKLPPINTSNVSWDEFSSASGLSNEAQLEEARNSLANAMLSFALLVDSKVEECPLVRSECQQYLSLPGKFQDASSDLRNISSKVSSIYSGNHSAEPVNGAVVLKELQNHTSQFKELYAQVMLDYVRLRYGALEGFLVSGVVDFAEQIEPCMANASVSMQGVAELNALPLNSELNALPLNSELNALPLNSTEKSAADSIRRDLQKKRDLWLASYAPRFPKSSDLLATLLGQSGLDEAKAEELATFLMDELDETAKSCVSESTLGFFQDRFDGRFQQLGDWGERAIRASEKLENIILQSKQNQVHTAVLETTLNVVTGVSRLLHRTGDNVVGCIGIAVCTSLMLCLHQLLKSDRKYFVHRKNLGKGERMYDKKHNDDEDFPMSSVPYFLGVAVSSSFTMFALYSLVIAFILLLLLSEEFIALLSNPWVSQNCIELIIVQVVSMIMKVIVSYSATTHTGTVIVRPVEYCWWAGLTMYLGIASGVLTGVARSIFIPLISIRHILIFDSTVFPKSRICSFSLACMDAGYCAYHSLLSMKHRHTNPIWATFNWCNNEAWANRQNGESSRSQKPRSSCWIRWQVATTLARNPHCISMRRGQGKACSKNQLNGHEPVIALHPEEPNMFSDMDERQSMISLEPSHVADQPLCPTVPYDMVSALKVPCEDEDQDDFSSNDEADAVDDGSPVAAFPIIKDMNFLERQRDPRYFNRWQAESADEAIEASSMPVIRKMHLLHEQKQRMPSTLSVQHLAAQGGSKSSAFKSAWLCHNQRVCSCGNPACSSMCGRANGVSSVDLVDPYLTDEEFRHVSTAGECASSSNHPKSLWPVDADDITLHRRK